MSKNFYLNDWITFDGDTGKINIYEKPKKVKSNLSDALKEQANIIYEHHKDIVVFVSGGIDSQMVAYGFKRAGIPVKYVFMKVHYEDRLNKQEWFFANEFAKKYDIPLEIHDVVYDKKSLVLTIKKYNFFKRQMRLGSLIQCDTFEKYYENTGLIPVHGVGNFTYMRNGTTCKGMIPNPNTGSTDGTNDVVGIPFFFFSPQLSSYYEQCHKNDRIIQWHEKYQPKNFAYTELGWSFRPKLVSAEQIYELDGKQIPLNFMTMIDYGLDRNASAINKFLNNGKPQIDKTTGIRKNIIRLLGLDQDQLKTLFDNKPEYKKTYVQLYEFETDVETWS